MILACLVIVIGSAVGFASAAQCGVVVAHLLILDRIVLFHLLPELVGDGFFQHDGHRIGTASAAVAHRIYHRGREVDCCAGYRCDSRTTGYADGWNQGRGVRSHRHRYLNGSCSVINDTLTAINGKCRNRRCGEYLTRCRRIDCGTIFQDGHLIGFRY